jgi:hypothetical protein|tara:strand:+ start:22 stop:225 length:204 start_codon:yes stop_codon:yes gene_type:complete
MGSPMKYHNYKFYKDIPQMEIDYITKLVGVSSIEDVPIDGVNEIMDNLYHYFALGGTETNHFFIDWD